MIIPYSKQKITKDDIEAVCEVLNSDYLTQGPKVPQFEKEIALYCGAKKGVATNSATSALHVACLALGLKKDDIVWTSAITFVSTANCAVYCGAKVDFVDINLMTYNIDVDILEKKLIKSKKEGNLPKIIIPVHMCGQSCDMEKIFELSKEYGFKIIEDASHAFGAKYKNKPVGNCEFSDITVFSFHPVKIITSAEGGVAVTNDFELANRMERLRSHGITRDVSEMKNPSDGPWFYQQLDLGFNYRMSDIHAALGVSQLKKVDEYVKERQKAARFYNKLIDPEIAELPKVASNCFSSFHLYILQINVDTFKVTQKEIFERLRSAGFFINLHYIPVYKHPFYRNNGHTNTFLKNSESYYSKALSIPIYPGITEEVQTKVIDILKKPLGHQSIF